MPRFRLFSLGILQPVFPGCALLRTWSNLLTVLHSVLPVSTKVLTRLVVSSPAISNIPLISAACLDVGFLEVVCACVACDTRSFCSSRLAGLEPTELIITATPGFFSENSSMCLATIFFLGLSVSSREPLRAGALHYFIGLS